MYVLQDQINHLDCRQRRCEPNFFLPRPPRKKRGEEHSQEKTTTAWRAEGGEEERNPLQEKTNTCEIALKKCIVHASDVLHTVTHQMTHRLTHPMTHIDTF